MNREVYEKDVCRRLSQAEYAPFKEVSLGDWRPQVAHCHKNVDAWVAANPGSIAVRGWVTCADLVVAIGLTAHSVVQGPDGELFDITPLENERYRQGMRFIRHLGDDPTFDEARDERNCFPCPCGEGTE